MKKKINSLIKATAFVIVALLTLNSCTPEKLDPPKPDPPCTTCAPDVIAIWTVSPTDTKRKDTSFWLENRNVSVALTNATNGGGIDGESGSSTNTGPMTAPKTITAWGKNSDGKMFNFSKVIPVYTSNKTGLVGNVSGIKWHPEYSKKTIVSDTLINPAPNAIWENGVISTLDRRFYTDGTGSAYGGPVSPSYFVYTLLEGDNWINFQQVPQKILQVTDTILVLRWWSKDPFSPIWFCSESYYSKS